MLGGDPESSRTLLPSQPRPASLYWKSAVDSPAL